MRALEQPAWHNNIGGPTTSPNAASAATRPASLRHFLPRALAALALALPLRPARRAAAARPWARLLAATNEPTPASMSPVPKVSALAKRRGKAGKSTPRMAMQVRSISEAR